MTGSDVRARFLQHFEARGHLKLPSASLIPDRDPTTLLISAGMQPLKPYYLGLRPPPAPRLVSCQKCFRTGDLEQVGRTDRHLTFFEMLGNFSPTGDYFKEGAIPAAWELLTEVYGIPVGRLRVTVHPTDGEARRLWIEVVGLAPDRVHDNAENWWAAGETGPCGPDSEIWFDRGPEAGCGRPDCVPDHCDRYLEVWNLVFMQYDRQFDGTLVPLPRPGIDTGMGLERMTAVLNGRASPFETDLFAPMFEFVAGAATKPETVSSRVVADHLRGMTFLISDGVTPGNEGRGYVLRRVLRRAALHARRMEMRRPLSEGIGSVVSVMAEQYPELRTNQPLIEAVVAAEEARFERTLQNGLEQFERIAAGAAGRIEGEEAFLLHDTFGLPFELTVELAAERGLEVDRQGFEEAMTRQRQRSRTMSGQRWPDVAGLPQSRFTGYEETQTRSRVTMIRVAGEQVESASEGEEAEVYLEATPFYGEAGGQVGDTGEITGESGSFRVDDTQRPAEGVIAHLGTVVDGSLKVGETVTARINTERRRAIMRHHTATHLLHRALRIVLGETAVQRGSWVGPDHSTFDFPLARPVSREELSQISAIVTAEVRAAHPFHAVEVAFDDAVAMGAMHLFDQKYGERVRVVSFGEFSRELCGGTHVSSTADTAPVLILSESSIGAGLRRIDFVAGEPARELVERRLMILGDLARGLGVAPERALQRVSELQAQLRSAERAAELARAEVRRLRLHGAGGGGRPEMTPARVPLIMRVLDGEAGGADLRAAADELLSAIGGSGVVFVTGDRAFVIKVSRDLAGGISATELKELVGRGGGRPELAQGRLEVDPDEAMERIRKALQ